METELRGRTYLVTGANTGIGRATAHDLARRGGRVFLACRSPDKTKPVVEAIRAETGNDAVEPLPLDLGSLASVRACAKDFLARDLPLHVLVNNAGVGGQRGQTADGFELAFGTNHLGHFLLTQLLLERLRASAPARIVNVASTLHRKAAGIDFEAVRRPTATYTGQPEYCVSKLCNVLFTAELTRRYAASRITSYSLHPGVIGSDIYRRVPWPFRSMIKAFMKSPEEGARTSLYCATAPELEGKSGGYYDEGKERQPSRLARDEELARRLWDKSVEWTAAD